MSHVCHDCHRSFSQSNNLKRHRGETGDKIQCSVKRAKQAESQQSQVSVPVPEELLVENAMYRGILVGLHACSYVK